MFGKELLEKDVLNRIRWDKRLKPEEYTICYLDRFSSKLKELKYSEITIDGDFIQHGESRIPVHRIREIKRNGKVVWARRRKG